MFGNPLIASAAMDRLVHRTVKFVIEGKIYCMDSFVRRARGIAAALGGPAMRPNRRGAQGCPDTTSPGGGALQTVLARSFSWHPGRTCAPKLADRAISAFPALPSLSRLAQVGCPPPTTGRCRAGHPAVPAFGASRSCPRLESDGTEYPHKGEASDARSLGNRTEPHHHGLRRHGPVGNTPALTDRRQQRAGVRAAVTRPPCSGVERLAHVRPLPA